MISRSIVSLIVVFGISSAATAVDIANFDDLVLEPNSYWYGSDGSGGFQSGSAYFFNNYVDWGGGFYSWDGFSYSNMINTTTAGLENQYSAITGGGFDSNNYGVSWIALDWMSGSYEPIPTQLVFTDSKEGYKLAGAYLTNTTYAYFTIKNGDMFSKPFGGETGDDPDWFLLTITGKDADDNITGTVDFYLADYRFEDNSLDYIVDRWEYVDLSSLGVVKSLEFTLNSSDAGMFGMNTPAYFAIDKIILKPTPLMQAIENLENAITSKTEAIAAINTSLEKERIAINALNALLNSGELNGMKASDIRKTKAKICAAMMCERMAKRTLRKTIETLEEALKMLPYENEQ